MFAGYGGLELAAHAVLGNLEAAWVADIDPGAARILAHRFPGVPNLGDVTTADYAAHGPVDLLTTGFPCQDVSHGGLRKGLIRTGAGATRSGLWGQTVRAIETLRPALVLAENVRGLLSARADSDVEPCPWCLGDDDGEPAMRALGAVLADLADVGYDAGWVGLRAADVGAPHGRFRVFILAWPAADAADTGVATVAGAFNETSRGTGDLPLGDGAAPVNLLRTPTAQLAVNGGSQHPDKRKAGGHGPTLADEVEHLLPTPAVNDMGAGKTVEAWDEWTARMKAAHGNGNGHGPSLAIEAARGADAFGRYAPAVARWEALTRPAPPPTGPTGKDGAHRLAPAFVEWMMGLPAGWVTDPAIWAGLTPGTAHRAQLKALGNGVVPAQAAAALRHLLTVRAAEHAPV